MLYASTDPAAIRAIIRDRLRRRLSAPRRIGCAYRLASVKLATGFDVESWLPRDILVRFRSTN